MEFQNHRYGCFPGVEYASQVRYVHLGASTFGAGQPGSGQRAPPRTLPRIPVLDSMGGKMDGKNPARVPKSISEWARTQRELLKLERDEEKSQVADTIAQLSAQVTAVLPLLW